MYLKKKIKNVFFATSLIYNIFFGAAVSAQEITAINFNGEPIGKVIPDGKVISFDNSLLGNVTADSLIIDSSGKFIGGVVPQGVVIGNDTKFLGKVGNDGKVRSPSGQISGRALPNGLVVDETFSVIGQVIFPGLVYGDNGNVVGRITGDGLYTNLGGQQIGVVTPDGYAYRRVGNDYILDGKLISSKMVVSLSGDFIGSVVPGGQVTDFESQTIGSIKANGFVYNAQGEIVGRVVPSGYAFDNNGYYLGLVSYNGEVINNNKVVGKLRADGRISNINGAIVGKYTEFAATATDLTGHFLGLLQPNGNLFGRDGVNGTVGVRGKIFDAANLVIGALTKTGPVYDYKGEHKGHALSNGSVIALNGTTIGYLIGDKAHSLSGVMIGQVLQPRAVYSSDNKFLGISGINGATAEGGGKISVSPFGYAFSSGGDILGYSKPLDAFYGLNGTIVGYQGLNGKVVNAQGSEVGRLSGLGYALNSQNRLVAKNNSSYIAVDYRGKRLGLLNDENLLLNDSSTAYAKILPDNSVAEIKSGNNNYMPKTGQSYWEAIALDFNGRFLGYVDYTGSVNNLSQSKIGSVVGQNFVEDNGGKIIGYITGYNSVINNKCEFLGVVNSQGDVYNYRDVYIGKILSEGLVMSDSGTVVGHTIPAAAVIDFNGAIVGYSNHSGHVISPDGTDLGCLNSQKQLRDKNNNLLGKIVESSSVIDFKGKIIGYTTLDGLVVNDDNAMIGYQQPDGNVNSTSGANIGMVFKYKVAFDFNNKFMGYVSKDGKVINSSGTTVAKVDFDGYVLTDKGEKTGYALYDFYVYDNDLNPVGIINQQGEVTSFSNQSLGQYDRGFVIKDKAIVARGNRDYNIRSKDNKILGFLYLNNDVRDNTDSLVGKLAAGGKINSSENKTIAQATPLQYYDLTSRLDQRKKVYDENGNIIKRADGKTPDKDGAGLTNVYDKNGQKIGKTNEKGEVFDEKGNLVGVLNSKGELIDEDGNIIGSIDPLWFNNSDILENFKEPDLIEEDSDTDDAEAYVPEELLKDGKYLRSIGIALTPDGEYLGEILEDGSVVDKNNEVIAYQGPDGLIYDEDGNIVGMEKGADSKISDGKGIFIPGTEYPGGPYDDKSGPGKNVGPGGGHGPGERYDPVRQAALQAAMQERRQNISVGKISTNVRKEAFDGYQKDWSEQGIPKSISSWRVDMSEMIFSDKPIPAVIARAIDTNNPAPVTAYVERNVYAEEGRNIIIPAGSRLIGAFGSITAASEATSESARVQITWERLIRPDGSIFVFSGQTADAQGRAGALGYVDQQLFKKYTLPVVTTVLTSATSYFMAAAEDSAGDVETSKQQAANDARQNFLSDMESLFDDILADKTDIKARTYVPAGTRIIVYPNTDLWLRTIERDAEESAEILKPEVFIDDVKIQQESDNQNRRKVAESSKSSVVYDPEEADVEAVGGSVPLLNDTAPKKKNTRIAPPPPSYGGSVPTTGTTPSTTTTTSTGGSSSSTNDGIPALF